ncbi:single-stranded DNA-binding protein rim1, mitochondrial [Cladorrhinum sp. PSN259]|nr:single-stranded DNA-binding protein rim1, mitochondrial [Cladorrhinum sp. PSN259]
MSAFLRNASRAIARPAVAARSFSSTAKRDVARITIVGNLADTPEIRASSTGREYLRYSVASNTGFKDNRVTSWFNVTSFIGEGPQRDFLSRLDKGTLVMVEGEASINTYTDAEGKARQTLSIIQRNIEVLRRPFRGGQEGGEHQ